MASSHSKKSLGPIRTNSGRRSGLLKNQVQLVKRNTLDGTERYELVSVEETLSFDKGFFLFIRAIQMLLQKNEGVVLVGLAGPSGAGKTVFSEKVSSFMPGIVVISMDNYNDASRVIDGNYDDPRLTDYDTLMENIEGLRRGEAVDVPIYDFKTSSRVGTRRVEVPASRVVVIEGIYALSSRLRPLLDLRVSVTGGVHFDLVKRVLRDINRSGQEPEDIIHQISETVYPMYKAFIEPDLQTAHIKIVNKFNPFSGFQNATYILKSGVHLTEDQIRAVLSPTHTEATEETYDIYLLPPGEDRETCQSYLRMRNRDGRYSLMFEEWVTDGPFIISPRITFEVSVKILSGLLALGYTMPSILKRISHVFSDNENNFTVKIDKLEQLQRTYVQVQGKDRQTIQDIAESLGMNTNYVPRSYIEQIQLERLTAEVQAVPEELQRLGVSDEIVSSPRFASSYADPSHITFKPLPDKLVQRSQSWHQEDRARMESGRGGEQTNGESGQEAKESGKGSKADSSNQPSSPTYYADAGLGTRVTEQLQAITDRLDELMSRLHAVEMRLPEKGSGGGGGAGGGGGGGGVTSVFRGTDSQQTNGYCSAAQPTAGSSGSQSALNMFSLNGGVGLQNGTSNAVYHSHGNGNGVAIPDASSLADELRQLLRGQRHLTTQLDMLGGLIRDTSINSTSLYRSQSERSWRETLLSTMKTGHSGLVTVAIAGLVGTLAVGTAVALRIRK